MLDQINCKILDNKQADYEYNNMHCMQPYMYMFVTLSCSLSNGRTRYTVIMQYNSYVVYFAINRDGQ